MGQDTISVISGSLLEDVIENNDEQSYDFYTLYDELKAVLDNPINLNTCGYEDLQELGLLQDYQIVDILKHRDEFGNYISRYELQSIPSLDYGTLTALIPFVSVNSNVTKKNIGQLLSQANHTVVAKYKRFLQEKRGFTDEVSSPYLGDANHYYLRYNLQSSTNLRMGLTMEKDPGEEFFTGSNPYGFDYYSGFLYFRDIHPVVRSLVVGDYSISMGQGLIMHNNFGGSKSSYVMNIKKGGRVIKPYSSVNEFNLLRGGAATIQAGEKLKITAFASQKKVDGNVILNDTLIDTGFERFSSFVVNGLHRTQREIDKKDAVTQSTFGFSTKYQPFRAFYVGFHGLHNRFDVELQPSKQLYRKYAFSGNSLTNLSADYSYRYQNINLFGEVARSDNGGIATVNGAFISMGRNIDAAIMYRNYSKSYQVLYANAFGESSQPINERGLYLSLQYKPWKSITVSHYADIWKHPWLRSRANGPSQGKEFLTKIEYYKKRKFKLYAQYRYESKEENSSNPSLAVKYLTPRTQHRLRLNFDYTYSKELSLISRAEYAHYTKEENLSKGYLMFQDIKYKPIEKPYSFAMRYAIFDTDDSNSRIYAYENDVLYEFSIPFYSGSGTRFYIKGQYNLNRNMYVQLRYARTYLDDVNDVLQPDGSWLPLSIGSGNERILGHVRSDIKLVFKYKIR